MKQQVSENKNKRVFNLIIVDESGSMSVIQRQAFAGMNETLQTVRTLQQQFPQTEQRVTLVTFDSDHTKWHYDNSQATDTTNLDWNDYNPGGATPLYDAMGSAIAKVKRQVSEGDNVLVTVITDGEENCSREWTLTAVRTLIEELKKNGWTFTLIGTDNLDVESMAQSFAIDEHLQFRQDVEGTAYMFAKERRSRVRYNRMVASEASMPAGSFFDED